MFDEFNGLFEIFIGFTREADNQVGGYSEFGVVLSEPIETLVVFFDRYFAFHCFQYRVTTALNGEVDVLTQLGLFVK